jgi:DNA repair exonuclease SbcCD ATPase subunit
VTPNALVASDVTSVRDLYSAQAQVRQMRENAFYDDYPGESVDVMNYVSQEMFDIHKNTLELKITGVDKKVDSVIQDAREIRRDVSEIKAFASKIDALIVSNQARVEKLDERNSSLNALAASNHARIEKLDALIASNQALAEKLDQRMGKLDDRLWLIVGGIIASIAAQIVLKFWP